MIVVVENGQIDGIDLLIDKLSNKDGVFFVDIRESRNSRSLQQNRYYWGVVLKALSDDTGYSAEEMHQLMAEKFLNYEKGEYVFVRSTTSLNTKEFEEYLSQIRLFANTELGIFIPEPNEAGFDL